MCGAPYLTQQMTMREHLAAMRGERGQQFVFDWRQVQIGTVALYAVCREVDSQRTDFDARRCIAAAALGETALRHAQACEKFADAERLAQIIVRARVERGDLVGLLTARRQHKNRPREPFAQT